MANVTSTIIAGVIDLISMRSYSWFFGMTAAIRYFYADAVLAACLPLPLACSSSPTGEMGVARVEPQRKASSSWISRASSRRFVGKDLQELKLTLS